MRRKPEFLRFGHFAKRRNNTACSAEVLRINFLALPMDMVRRGCSLRGGSLDVGRMGVMIVSFSIASFKTIVVGF